MSTSSQEYFDGDEVEPAQGPDKVEPNQVDATKRFGNNRYHQPKSVAKARRKARSKAQQSARRGK